MYSSVANIWRYRRFIYSSIQNEFLSRFIRSKIGGVWMIINPLTQVAIYSLILSNLISAKIPDVDGGYSYALYLMAGMAAWSLFLEIINRCLTIFISNGNLMKKMKFPRIALPIIVVGSCIINYILLLIAILLIFTFLGHAPGIEVLWLIPLTLLVLILAIGFGLIFGVMNVFMRDIGHVLPIALQLLFWFTPIVYPLEIVPELLKKFIEFNPMMHIVNAYHNVLVFGLVPDWTEYIGVILFSVVLFFISGFVFRKAVSEMVDVL